MFRVLPTVSRVAREGEGGARGLLQSSRDLYRI